MTSNLPQTQKTDWVGNDVVKPVDTNSWGEAINTLSKAVPIYASNGDFYTVQSYENNIITLMPLTYLDGTENETLLTYLDGMNIIFKATFTNTGECSVTVNELGIKQIKNIDNTLLKSDTITQGNYINLRYDKLQDCFYLIRSNSGGGLENKITNCILEAPNGVATYSGNTITIKQGLKALAPNGRNADRTLRNNEYKVNNDFTIIINSIYIGKHYLYLTNNDSASYTSADHVFVKSSANGFGPHLTPSTKEQWYDDYTNYDNVHLENQSNWDIISDVIIGEFYWDGSIISHFITYAPIDILKRSNKSEISGWGMPSSKYIDLTLGASGATYTAPANGYYAIRMTSSEAQFISMVNDNNGAQSFQVFPGPGWEAGTYIEVKKGQVISIHYNCPTKNMFRFIYAEGDE